MYSLFFEITRILKHHHPKYIILENVKNLTRHDKGRTWQIIEGNLKELGYQLTEEPLIVSPHHFGTPQLRERVIILGVYQAKEPLTINLGNQLTKDDNSIYEVLDAEVDGYDISEEEEKVLTEAIEKVLGIEKVSVLDNFFDLGGDSLVAIKLQTEALKYNLNINYQNIFEIQYS